MKSLVSCFRSNVYHWIPGYCIPPSQHANDSMFCSRHIRRYLCTHHSRSMEGNRANGGARTEGARFSLVFRSLTICGVCERVCAYTDGDSSV